LGEEIIYPKLYRYRGPGAEDKYIEFVEKNLGVKFPPLYIECVKQGDFGRIKDDCFWVTNPYSDEYPNEMMQGSLGAFTSFNPLGVNVLTDALDLPYFFPKGLLPISDDGGGNYVCFDYRKSGWNDPNPPVVFWIHDAAEDKSIAFVANNFGEFLLKLVPNCDDE